MKLPDTMDSSWDSTPWREAAVVGAVTVAALVLRWHFGRYHMVMVPDYDGADYLYEAANVTRGGQYCSPIVPPGITILLSLALPFFKNPQSAGMFVSAVFGAGLCTAVYLFAKELFGRRVALVSAFFTAVFGQLITASTWVMAEMPFAFVLFLGMYAGLVFQRRRTFAAALFFGLLFGVAYEIRPEAFVIFFMLSALLAAEGLSGAGAGRRKVFLGLTLSVFVMLALCMPYILYLKHALGHWTVSGRVEYNMADTESSRRAAMSGGPVAYVQEHLGALAGKYWTNLPGFVRVLKSYWSPVLLVLAAIGLSVSHLMAPRRIRGTLYIAVPLVFTLALPFFFLDQRILEPYYPVLLVLAGAGTVFLEDRLLKFFKAGGAARFYPVTAAVALYVGIYYMADLEGMYNSDSYRQNMQYLRARYLLTGSWLNEHSRPGDKVMSRERLFVFYSGREFVNLPDSPPDKLWVLAKTGGARFVIVDDISFTKRTQLGPLLAPFIGIYHDVPGFSPVFENDEGNVIIYKVEGVS